MAVVNGVLNLSVLTLTFEWIELLKCFTPPWRAKKLL